MKHLRVIAWLFALSAGCLLALSVAPVTAQTAANSNHLRLSGPTNALAQRVLTEPLEAVEGDRIPASDEARITPRQTNSPAKSGRPYHQPTVAEEPRRMISSREARLRLHEAFQLSQSGSRIQDFSEIIELCRRAKQMELAPDEADYAQNLLSWAYNRRGEMWSAEAATLSREGHAAESERLDRQALRDFEASVGLGLQRWKAIHNRGVSYGLLGLPEKALADFDSVLELKPDHINARFNRAEIHLEQGHFTEAVEDYTEVIDRVPADAAAYFGRARAFALEKRHAQALHDFTVAVNLEPTQPVYLVERGEIYTKLGDWRAAAADFRTAIKLDGDHAPAYRSAAWLMATCPETKYRNARLALEAAERAFNLAETHSTLDYTYFDALAAALANTGHFSEAQELLREALPQSPPEAAPVLRQRLAMYAAESPYRTAGKTSSIHAASTKLTR